jgi:hypothetical protein
MNTAKQIGKQLSGVSGLSSSSGITRTLFKRQLWVWPIIAAVILGVLAWFTNRSIEGAMHQQMAAQLGTILNADIEAVRIWIKEQEVDAELMAAAGPVLSCARELVALADGTEAALLQSKPQAELRAYLQPRLKSYGYTAYFLITPSFRFVASTEDSAIGKSLDGYRAEFCKQVLGGRSAVSKPVRSVFVMKNEKGELQAGLPTIFAAAPVRDEKGQPIAVFAIRIPESRFSKILQVARSGESGETYAFDSNGLFLSESRFDDALKRAGILADSPDVRSILTLELRDPQVNLMAGDRPSLNRADQPLTRMAADAVAGGSGVDVSGHRDYRGVPVIGAWAWLPEYDFGVATQMDVAEAYQPLYILRSTFRALLGLLVLSAAAIFVFLIVVARQRRRMEKAEKTIKQLGQYTLEDKIGSGGMGSVYRARHAFLRRPTAIKMLNADNVTEGTLARFEREVQLTSRLNHPNTIAVYDYGRTPEGVFYYAMEYLEGITLEDLVKQFGPLAEGRALGILQQICGSLAEAHEIGLIHRDIKPANIILTTRAGIPDFVKVLDFGLVKAVDADEQAKLTQANVSVGTPYYMSPEAIERPDSVTALSDIYAIGAVGYFLLTGAPVFSGKTVMEICMKHTRANPDPPSKRLGRPVTPSVEAVILRCLAKAATDRPSSSRVLMEELAQCEPSQRWTRADAESWWATFKKPAGSGPEAPPTIVGPGTPGDGSFEVDDMVNAGKPPA